MHFSIRPIAVSNAPQVHRLGRAVFRPSPLDICTDYRPPILRHYGPLGALVRGASWKGVDSDGELDPDDSYPG